MIFKIIMALLCICWGVFVWRKAARWKADGFVPSEWNDGLGPAKVRQDRPDAFIAFQKGLAILLWLFALLCVVSLIFFPEL
jgi:hypothetical protein